jgi:hypothetical protein
VFDFSCEFCMGFCQFFWWVLIKKKKLRLYLRVSPNTVKY